VGLDPRADLRRVGGSTATAARATDAAEAAGPAPGQAAPGAACPTVGQAAARTTETAEATGAAKATARHVVVDLVLGDAGWHDPIPALLEAAEPGAVLHDDLYELPPLAAYTRGKVALVGDAAHAMTPNLGQGAGQALEDAVVLAKTVDGPSGLDAYDRLRRPRTQKIALRSHRIGVAAQWASPPAVTLRNTALRLLPGSSFARSLGPVLDWTA
jgi:2-polyprenyl-6-methoxyphenol hydroxylase-like FAD-dependent oxidoreductase